MSDGLTGVLERLEVASGGETTTVGAVLDHFSGRSLGAILALIGAIAAIPIIGGIPGMSIFAAVLTILACGQALLGGDGGLWAPERVKNKQIETKRIAKAVQRAQPYAKRLDRVLKERLPFLVSKPVVALSAIVLGLTFIPLAILPMGVLAPAFGVLLLGLSLIGRDGLFALFGYGMMLGAIYLVVSFAA